MHAGKVSEMPNPYDHPLARFSNAMVQTEDAYIELGKKREYQITLSNADSSCYEAGSYAEHEAWQRWDIPNMYWGESDVVKQYFADRRIWRRARARLGLSIRRRRY